MHFVFHSLQLNTCQVYIDIYIYIYIYQICDKLKLVGLYRWEYIWCFHSIQHHTPIGSGNMASLYSNDCSLTHVEYIYIYIYISNMWQNKVCRV